MSSHAIATQCLARRLSVSSVSFLLVLSLSFWSPDPASAVAPGASIAAQKAVDWIKSQQLSDGSFEMAGFPGFETPDAVAAIAAQSQPTQTWNAGVALAAVQSVRYLGSGPTPLDWLDDYAEQVVADGSRGKAAKLIVLVAVPLGLDPADFDPSSDSASPVDLSATLDPGGCAADTASFGFFNETLFAILAKYLVCNGLVPPSALATVRQAQQSNGGWNYLGDPTRDDLDVDTTGMAVQALVAGGADSSDPAITAALRFLASHLDPGGSWSTPFGGPDPNSTSLGILGVTAAGYEVGDRCWRDSFFPEGADRPYVAPDEWLISQQQPDGRIKSPSDSFGINTFATSQSVQALLRNWLPVARASAAACTEAVYLAEGATAGGFETWVLLANGDPDTDATARVTFLTGEGPVPGPVVGIPPSSRRSIRVDDYVDTFDVATKVETLAGKVSAERAVYTGTPGKEGAHLGKEIRRPAHDWFLPEGATAGGFETWVLVANPEEVTAQVSVTFLTGSGPVSGPSFSLPPGTRRSIRANDWVPDDYDVASRVNSTGARVVADHSVYSPPRLSGDATSGPGLPAG